MSGAGERDVLGSMGALMLGGFADFLHPLRFFLLAGVVLTLADLRFGIEAARARREEVRKSRAVRRTVNKMVDYLCWTLLAGALDKAFGVPLDMPLLPALVLLVVYGLEINSCYANYFEARGKKVRVDIFRIFAKKTDLIEVDTHEGDVEDNGKGGEA